jgi:phosphate transport system protein
MPSGICPLLRPRRIEEPGPGAGPIWSDLTVSFEKALKEISDDVVLMASKCEEMLFASADSLVELDVDAARTVFAMDDVVDALEVKVEMACLDALAQNALDLSEVRQCGSILKIVANLERVADLSVDIAKITLKIHTAMGRSDMVDFGRMARLVAQMLSASIRAFVVGDAAGMAQIEDWEDQVDEMYRRLRTQIQETMAQREEDVISGTWLILAIHHMERAADHCLNVAERVEFMLTGRLRQMGRGPSSAGP